MPLKITCPRCGVLHRNIDKTRLGQQFQCSCGKVVRLGSASGASRPRPVARPVERASRPVPVAKPDKGLPVAPTRVQQTSHRPAPKPVPVTAESKPQRPRQPQVPPAAPALPVATTRIVKPAPPTPVTSKATPPRPATSKPPSTPPPQPDKSRPVSPPGHAPVAESNWPVDRQPGAAKPEAVPEIARETNPIAATAGKDKPKPIDLRKTPAPGAPVNAESIPVDHAEDNRNDDNDDDREDSVDALIHDLVPMHSPKTRNADRADSVREGVPPASKESWNNRDDDLELADSGSLPETEPSFEVLDSFEVLEDEVIEVIGDEDVVEVICDEDVVEVDDVIEITEADLAPALPKPKDPAREPPVVAPTRIVKPGGQ